jgi:hypothetical protein
LRILGRLWEELGIGDVLKELLKDRVFRLDVERIDNTPICRAKDDMIARISLIL